MNTQKHTVLLSIYIFMLFSSCGSYPERGFPNNSIMISISNGKTDKEQVNLVENLDIRQIHIVRNEFIKEMNKSGFKHINISTYPFISQ